MLLLLLVVGCAKPPVPRVATIYVGSSCDDSTASKAPVVRRATATDTALLRTGQAGLLVRVDSSTSNRRLARALARVKGTMNSAFANDSGQALLAPMPDGDVRLSRATTLVAWHDGIEH